MLEPRFQVLRVTEWPVDHMILVNLTVFVGRRVLALEEGPQFPQGVEHRVIQFFEVLLCVFFKHEFVHVLVVGVKICQVKSRVITFGVNLFV